MHDALAALSGALASGSVGAVLEAEPALADAVSALPGRDVTLNSNDRAELGALIRSALSTLDRCRQLGEAAREMAAAGLPMRGYGRAGAIAADAPHTIDSRS